MYELGLHIKGSMYELGLHIRGSMYELGLYIRGSMYELGLHIRGSSSIALGSVCLRKTIFCFSFLFASLNHPAKNTRQKHPPKTPAKYSSHALFFTIKADSILSSQAHTLLSSQPPPPRSTATRWSDIIKLLCARVKEEMWWFEHHAEITAMVDNTTHVLIPR